MADIKPLAISFRKEYESYYAWMVNACGYVLFSLEDNKLSSNQGRHASATTWLVRANGSIVL